MTLLDRPFIAGMIGNVFFVAAVDPVELLHKWGPVASVILLNVVLVTCAIRRELREARAAARRSAPNIHENGGTV